MARKTRGKGGIGKKGGTGKARMKDLKPKRSPKGGAIGTTPLISNTSLLSTRLKPFRPPSIT